MCHIAFTDIMLALLGLFLQWTNLYRFSNEFWSDQFSGLEVQLNCGD